MGIFFNVKEKLGSFYTSNNGVDQEEKLRSHIIEAEALLEMTKTSGWAVYVAITNEKVEKSIDLISNNPENAGALAGGLRAYREMHKEVIDRIARGKIALAELEKLKLKEKSNARITANR